MTLMAPISHDVLSDIRNDYLAAYRDTDEFPDDLYIHPRATLQPNDDDTVDLSEHLQAFLDPDSPEVVCLILGPAGSGKSTFNHHTARYLWDKYEETPDDAVIPLFISLASLHDSNNRSRDLIEAFFEEMGFDRGRIAMLKKSRSFISILDGYDEIQDRNSNFYAENKLASWNGKVIITCRPEYLSSNYRSQFHPLRQPQKLRQYWLAPFSQRMIEEYIHKYSCTYPEMNLGQFDEWISRPDLQELISNPFLLRMIVAVAPQMQQIQFTRGNIYYHFVRNWFDRSQARLNRICNQLTPQERETYQNLLDDDFSQQVQTYCQKFALALYRVQALEATYEHGDDPRYQEWAEFLTNTDRRTRLLRFNAPLNRHGFSYRFIHKSLRDYFIARAIYQDYLLESCSTQALINTFRVVDDPGVLDFMVEEAGHNSSFRTKLLACIENSKTSEDLSRAASNSITILVKAHVSFSGRDLRGARLQGADCSGGIFDSTNFQGANLEDVKWHSAWLRHADMSTVRLKGADFGELLNLDAKEDVLALKYAPDGRFLAMTMRNGDIEDHDTDGGTIFSDKLGFWSDINDIEEYRCASFSADGKFMVFGYVNTDRYAVIRVWSLSNHQVPDIPRDDQRQLWSEFGHRVSVAINSRLCSYVDGRSQYLFSLNNASPELIYKRSMAGVKATAISPDGAYLAFADLFDVCVVSISSLETLYHIRVAVAILGATALVFSHDSQILAAGYTDGSVRLWSVRNAQEIQSFSGDENISVQALAFSPDSQILASSGHYPQRAESIVRQRIISQRFNAERNIYNFNDYPTEMAFSPDLTLVASGGQVEEQHQSITIWSFPHFKLQRTLILANMIVDITGTYKDPRHQCSHLTFSADSRFLAVSTVSGVVHLWCTKTWEKDCEILLDPGIIPGTLAFSKNSEFIAVVCREYIHHPTKDERKTLANRRVNTHIKIWSLLSDHSVQRIDLHPNHYEGFLQFSPQGSLITYSAIDADACVWPVPDGEPLQAFRAHRLEFSPDGQRYVLCTNTSLEIRDIDSHQVLHSFNERALTATFSPDGRLIACGTSGCVKIWMLDPISKSFGKIMGILRSEEVVLSWNPNGLLTRKTFGSRMIKLWQITEEKIFDNQSWVQDTIGLRTVCEWTNPNRPLELWGLRVDGASGLTRSNKQILRQGGATGVRDPLVEFIDPLEM